MKLFYTLIILLSTCQLASTQNDDLQATVWYLHSIHINDTETYLSTLDSNNAIPFLEFWEDETANGFELFGNGTFTTFDGFYEVSNTSVNISSMSFNTETCEVSTVICDFESLYFTEVLFTEWPSPFTLNYQITGTGTNRTLKLTNPINNNFAVYGLETLQNPKFNYNVITIASNLIKDQLKITSKTYFIGRRYSIYSPEGKEIVKATKLMPLIDVSQLHSGLYFLKIDNLKALKFIKK